MKKFNLHSRIWLFSILLIAGNHLKGQATLPLSRTSWGSTPTGWTDSGTGSYSSSFACSGNDMGQLNSSGDYYQVYFSSSPDQLNYYLKVTGTTSSSCMVQQSSDGATWTTIVNHTSLPTSCTQYNYSLSSTTRYVRWTYTKVSENLGIDDVTISQPAYQINLYFQDFESPGTTIPNLPSNWSSIGSQIFTDNSLGSDTKCTGSGQVGQNMVARNCTPVESRSFQVTNISTTGMTDIYVSFCHRITSCFIPIITLEWSNDFGSSWNPISYSMPSMAGIWESYTSAVLPSGASNQLSLWFRWSYTTEAGIDPPCPISSFNSCTTASGNYRIDDFGVWANTVLPVELNHFTAKEQAKKVELSWQTQSETNSDYFQVEHSVNGTDFRPLAKIEAAGFSTTLLNYQFIHDSPANGTNYYRLNQFDLDGSGHFSRIVSVIVNRSGKTVIYPTPATNVIYLRLPEEITDAAELIISDNVGRLLKRFFIEPGVNEYAIAIDDLNPGHYLLSTQYGRTYETLRFIKH